MCARPAEPGPLRSVQAEAAPASPGQDSRKVSKLGRAGRSGRDRPHRPHRCRAKNHPSLPKQTAATARALAATQWHDARRPACAVRAQRGEASSGSQSPGPGPPPRPVAPDPGARVRVTGMPARPRRLGCSVPASSVGDGAGPCHEQWPCHRDQRQPPASPTRPSLPSSRRHCRWLGTRACGAQRHGARKAELPRHICTGCTRTGHICTRTRR